MKINKSGVIWWETERVGLNKKREWINGYPNISIVKEITLNQEKLKIKNQGTQNISGIIKIYYLAMEGPSAFHTFTIVLHMSGIKLEKGILFNIRLNWKWPIEFCQCASLFLSPQYLHVIYFVILL